MLVPINWLKEYVTFTLMPKELGWVLTELGLAVEKDHLLENEPVLELEVTPNRPDWLSIVGIAREISAATLNQLNHPSFFPIKSQGEPLINLKNDFQACPRYTAVSIKNVKVQPSPFWLQKRLVQVGLRPINNLVDITNYVMFELGNPIHCFDQDKIAGRTMTMKRARGGERFTTVDELSYQLPPNAVVIEDQEKVIDLCGIKGGLNTAITNQTKNIFVHVPVYEPVLIRRTTTALSLHSEAAVIYERGANLGGSLQALERAVGLMLELAGGEPAGNVIDQKKEKFGPRQIRLKFDHLDRILGISLDRKKIQTILTGLELKPAVKNEELVCTIPTFRADLQIAEDLIEELARHYGYNRLPKFLPHGAPKLKPSPFAWNERLEEKIKNMLTAFGFSEVSTYSLLGEEDLQVWGVKPGLTLRLANPVSRPYQYLQKSLLPSLLKAVQLNLPHQTEIALFELAHVFKGEKINKPMEETELAAVKLGLNYLEIKGYVEILTKRLGVEINFRPLEDKLAWSHPSQTAYLTVGKEKIGLVGLIHPRLLAKYGLSGHTVAYFSLNYQSLIKYRREDPAFKAPPSYPAIIEDLTVSLPPRTWLGEVIAEIKTLSKLITKVDLIDQYQNSFTFRLTYQDRQRSLSTKKIASVRKNITGALEKQFGGSVKEKS